MKKFAILFLAIAVMLFACAEDDSATAKKETVQFELDLQSPDDSGGRTASTTIPPGAIAKVEVLSPEGVISAELEVISFGSSYVTQPLELAVGANKLTSFLIVHESEVLFAAPKEGSPLASAVNNPLPQSFTIYQGKVKNLAVQVLDVSGTAPEFFGYASFGIEVMKPLEIAVYVEKPDLSHALTSASARLHTGDLSQPLQQFDLRSRTNFVAFKGDENVQYFLTIEKPGYQTQTLSFRYADLAPNFALSPLLRLDEPLVLTKSVTPGAMEFTLGIKFALGGSLNVDWGDGSKQVIETSSTDLISYKHVYASPGEYKITVDGELWTIGGLVIDGAVPGSFAEMNYLLDLSIRTSSLSVLDLSRNSRINRLEISSAGVADVRLSPWSKELKTVVIENLQSPESSNVFRKIHDNAAKWNITNGRLDVVNSPFTVEQFFIVYSLRDGYGWTVTVDGAPL
jgi:hypothetical protein